MQFLVLVRIKRIVSIDNHIVQLLLNTPIVFRVGEEKPHEAAQRRRRCVRRRNNSDDPIRGRSLESWLFFFEAGFVSLCEKTNSDPALL
jgi:hypothetical protein